MFSIDLKGIDQTKKRLANLKSQAPTILSNAINRTAFVMRSELQAELKTSFQAPTPWILKTIYVEKSTPTNLAATVGPNDYFGDIWTRILRPHVYGEKRPQKRFEERLERADILPTGWVTVPGRYMPMDMYGNPQRGELIKILSGLSALEIGNKNTARPSTKSKRPGTYRRGAAYFSVYPGRGSKLPPGIYRRTGGKSFLMILFVKSATYRKRIRWFETAKRVRNRELDKKIRSEMYKAAEKI